MSFYGGQSPGNLGEREQQSVTESPLCEPFVQGAVFPLPWVPGGYRAKGKALTISCKCLISLAPRHGIEPRT